MHKQGMYHARQTTVETQWCSLVHCMKANVGRRLHAIQEGAFRIGQPFSGPQELHQLFSKYDTNHSGQLEFNEFLELFKDRLQDLQKVLQFISLKPAKSDSSEASVLEVCLPVHLADMLCTAAV